MYWKWLVSFAVFTLLTGCQAISESPPTVAEQEEKDVKNVNQQLISTAERGDTDAVLKLLDQGAELNSQDKRGRTPVMAATHGKHPDTVKALIDAGADIDLQDERQDNPFLYAGAEGLLETLKLTIKAGADPTITNRFGGTALIPAAERGHVEWLRSC